MLGTQFERMIEEVLNQHASADWYFLEATPVCKCGVRLFDTQSPENAWLTAHQAKMITDRLSEWGLGLGQAACASV